MLHEDAVQMTAADPRAVRYILNINIPRIVVVNKLNCLLDVFVAGRPLCRRISQMVDQQMCIRDRNMSIQKTNR